MSALYATIAARYAFVPRVECFTEIPRPVKPLALSNLPVHYTGTNSSVDVAGVKRSDYLQHERQWSSSLEHRSSMVKSAYI
jgi:hypothetical protein